MSSNPSYGGARKAPFGGKPQGGFNKFGKNNNGGGFKKFDKKKEEVPAVPEKPLSRREQKLHAQLADSMANEAAAMKGTEAAPAAAAKKFDGKKPGDNKGKPVHPMVAAFGNNAANDNSYGKNPVDFCGKGHPFDRLQFGYSPSENDEARAFHSQWTAQQWIKIRTENYKKCIVKRQRLNKPNCEPLSTMFKLKRYWATISSNENTTGNIFDGAFAEDLLEQLASRQLRADEGALASSE